MDSKIQLIDEFVKNIGNTINLYKNKNVYEIFSGEGLTFQFSAEWVSLYEKMLSDETKKMGMSIAYIYSNGLYTDLVKKVLGDEICETLQIYSIYICKEDTKKHKFYFIKVITDLSDNDFLMNSLSFSEKYFINKILENTEKSSGDVRKRRL